MAKFAVILAAAGRSSRFRSSSLFGTQSPREKKPFRELKGRAVWLRAAEVFQSRDDVEQTLLVLAPVDMEWFREKFQPNLAFMKLDLVAGGEQRADSVQNALDQVNDNIDFVAVHDAARPLITTSWVNEVFDAAQQSGAALPAVPIASTVKRVESGVIEETVPRSGLYAAQTPQVFARDILADAFANRGNFQPTDEAQLVEQTGHPVTIVPGSPLNLKITTQDDLRMAEALLKLLPRENTLDMIGPGPDPDNPLQQLLD